MNWQFGIPEELGPYTYFKSLEISEPGLIGDAKRNLYRQATGKLHEGLAELNNEQKLLAADTFLATVAISEREKEIEAIKTYCKQTGDNFPILNKFLENPNAIYNDPEQFYLQLTKAINVARTGLTDYKIELERIKRNIDTVNGEGKNTRTVYSYMNDDYRYKLVNDITSFMAHLTGNEQWILEKTSRSYSDKDFTLKVQNIAMRILQKSNIINLIASGEDFAAIAVSVLMDVEQAIQKEVDKISPGKTLNNVSDELLDAVEKKYLKQLNSEDKNKTGVQRALNDINGTDFDRITRNAKQLLGLTIQPSRFKKLNDQLDIAKDYIEQSPNDLIKQLRTAVSHNPNLPNNLRLLDFNIAGSSRSKHGTINELVLGILGSKVRGNVATDIITYKISWKEQINDRGLDTLINQIGDQFSSVLEGPGSHLKANMRDIRNDISNANQTIEGLIAEAEKQLKTLENFQQDNNLFIFHETVKLYSSVETGSNTRHKGFSGRNMNILSYIDYLSSAAMIGLSKNDIIDRDILAFFARNLVKGAIAEDYAGPLERYFNIYAGMIMFDDVIAMAKEAVAQINNSNNIVGGKIKQVHLYNVNGIYVPASMILSHFSDSLSKDNKQIMEDLISTHIEVTDISSIDASNKDNKFKNKQRFYNNFKTNLYESIPLSEDDWNKASSIAVENTKVSIIFLMSFTQFIKGLLKIS